MGRPGRARAHEVAASAVAGGIVVGYDGSQDAYGALCWAVDEARRRELRLHVVRAWTIGSALAQVARPYGSIPSVQELAAELSRQTDRDLADAGLGELGAQVHLIEGSAAKTLVALSERAEMVVVGSRGLGGFAGLVLGSSAAQVVHHARCTVVVVRPARDAG